MYCAVLLFKFSRITLRIINYNILQGEYTILFTAIYPCESTMDHIFGWNLYFSKKSQNITEIKGNLTFLEAFDDSTKVSNIYLFVSKIYLSKLFSASIFRKLHYFNSCV